MSDTPSTPNPPRRDRPVPPDIRNPVITNPLRGNGEPDATDPPPSA
jgi:hypothetical protein